MSARICVLFYISVRLLVDSIRPSSPQCDQSFPDTVINHILQNPNDASIYDLGHASAADECQAKCDSLNYICGASTANANNFIYNDEEKSTFTFNHSSCELDIVEPIGGNWGSKILLTPDFLAPSNEYIIDLNFTIFTGIEAGLVFKHSWSQQPGYWLVLNVNDQRIINGDFTATGFRSFGHKEASPIFHHTPYNLRLHREATDDRWSVYLNGVFQWSWRSDTMSSSSLLDHVGFYARGSHSRAHSLTVSFPSSLDEALCAAYVYNKDTSQCDAYYGSNYSVLYSTLTTSTMYQSGIMQYNTCTTFALTTSTPTISAIETLSPTTTSTQPTLFPTTPEPTSIVTTTAESSVVSATLAERISTTVLVDNRGNITSFDDQDSDVHHRLDAVSQKHILYIVFAVAAVCICCGAVILTKLCRLRRPLKQVETENYSWKQAQSASLSPDASVNVHVGSPLARNIEARNAAQSRGAFELINFAVANNLMMDDVVNNMETEKKDEFRGEGEVQSETRPSYVAEHEKMDKADDLDVIELNAFQTAGIDDDEHYNIGNDEFVVHEELNDSY